jgi:hypothetical protein
MKRTLLLLLALTACGSDDKSPFTDASTGLPDGSDASTPGGGDGDAGAPVGDGDAALFDGGSTTLDAGLDGSAGGELDGATGSELDGAVADGGDSLSDGGTSGDDAGELDDAGTPGPKYVPIFVAVGYQGRHTASCDGLLWKHDETAESDADAGTPVAEDDTLIRGLAHGNHMFVASMGGTDVQDLLYTEDGFTWTTVALSGNGFSDVTFGNGHFVAGGGHVARVSADGKTWGALTTMGEGGALRHLAFTDYQGGRFAAAGDDGRRMNSGDGVTWGHQVEEGDAFRGLAGGNGVFVGVSSSGATRYSSNGGDSWETGTVGGDGARGILWDGIRFIVTSDTGAYFSTNGKDWEFKGGGTGPFAMAVNDDRTHYVGVEGNNIYHSADGIGWERKHSEGGPDFTRVKFGWVKASLDCPAP